MSKRKKRKWVRWIILLALLAVAAWYLQQRYMPRVKLRDRNYVFIYVEQKDLLEDVSGKLYDEGLIGDQQAFEWLAEKMGMRENLHPGKYRITNGMNVRQIINLIRYGNEEKIKLTFNSQIRDLDEFVSYVDDKLELSDEELEAPLSDAEKLDMLFGLQPQNAFALVVPGTMKVSWAVTADEFFRQMSKRYHRHYTPQKIARARALGYSIHEIQVLASIVQSESYIASEQKKIAGVYFNRLRRRMPLQADPTLKYACRNYDLQRILNKDKEVDSPYNTYKRRGLPPGPICLITKQALDATLNYTKHNYLYFCARPDLKGYSDFSATYDQHRRRAVEYRKALDRRGITR